LAVQELPKTTLFPLFSHPLPSISRGVEFQSPLDAAKIHKLLVIAVEIFLGPGCF
jgi:hypothetical protein